MKRKYIRNKSGRFDRDRRLYKVFLIVLGVYSLSMIGVNTIVAGLKSLERTFTVENVQAEEVIVSDPVEERIQYLKGIIYQKAKVYKVDGYQMERTIECESRFNNIQSTAYQNGIQEDSWGIAQIHLPSHPSVSREDALDERFAIEWMAKNFNNPYVIWYAYLKDKDKCAI